MWTYIPCGPQGGVRSTSSGPELSLLILSFGWFEPLRALGTAPTCMAADRYGNKHALLGAASLVLLAFLLLFLHFSPETVVIAAVMLGLGSNAPLVLGHLAVHELTEGVAHAQSASFAAFGHAVRLGTVVGLVLAGVATIHYGYIAGTFMQAREATGCAPTCASVDKCVHELQGRALPNGQDAAPVEKTVKFELLQ